MCPPNLIPFLRRPMWSGPGGRHPPGKPRTWSRPPVVGDRRWLGVRSMLRALGDCRGQVGFSFTRATSVSPRTTVNPDPTSHGPAMVRLGRMALIQLKTKQQQNKTQMAWLQSLLQLSEEVKWLPWLFADTSWLKTKHTNVILCGNFGKESQFFS